jgi:hypothetical protein
MPRRPSGAICVGVVMFASAAWAATLTPNVDPLAPAWPQPGAASAATNTASSPAAIDGQQTAGLRCTIAAITEDAGTSDTYLSRTTFFVSGPPVPAGQEPVCPPGAAQAATQRALAACKRHAANPESCVHADTDHMFDISTDVVDSSPLDSQCFSTTSKFIGIACRSGTQHQANCSVACGATAAAATEAARTRCRANHDGDCTLVNAAPVRAP